MNESRSTRHLARLLPPWQAKEARWSRDGSVRRALALLGLSALLISIVTTCGADGGKQYEYLLDDDLHAAANLLPSPDQRLVAFSFPWLSDSFPWAVRVIDTAGETVWRTSAPAGTKMWQRPVGWFPSGRTVLALEKPAAGNQSERSDAAERGSRLVAVDTGTGEVRDVFDPAEGHATGPYVVDSDRLLCRLSHGARRPGLYLLEKGDDGWGPEPILLDNGTRRWREFHWARRERDRIYGVVSTSNTRTEKREFTGGPAEALWRVRFEQGQELERELVASLQPWARSIAVSPDGQLAAAVLHRPGGPNPVRCIRLGSRDREVTDLQPAANIGFATFSPSGTKLLLWDTGFPRRVLDKHPKLLLRAALVVIEADDLQMSKVAIPQAIDSVSGAAWLGESHLLVSASHQGIFRVELSSGECELIWQVPERDSPQNGRAD